MGMANGLDAALHFCIPIVLVRLLSVEQFGEYRLLWLAASSAMLFAPMGMPRSLQYFLPRNNEEDRREFIDQPGYFSLGKRPVIAAPHVLGMTPCAVDLFAGYWIRKPESFALSSKHVCEPRTTVNDMPAAGQP